MSGLAASRPRSLTATNSPYAANSANVNPSTVGGFDTGPSQYANQSAAYADVNGGFPPNFDANMTSADLLAVLGSAGGTLASEPSTANGLAPMDSSNVSTDFKFPEMPMALLEQAPEYEYSAHTKANVFAEATFEDLAQLMPEPFDSGMTQASPWSSAGHSYDSTATAFEPYAYTSMTEAGPSLPQALPPYGADDWGNTITPRQATFNMQSIQQPYPQPLFPQQEVPFGHVRSTSNSAASQDYEPSLLSAGGMTPSKQPGYDFPQSVKKRRTSPGSAISASPSSVIAGSVPSEYQSYSGVAAEPPYYVDAAGRPMASRMGAGPSSIQQHQPNAYYTSPSIPSRTGSIPPGPSGLAQSYPSGQNGFSTYPSSSALSQGQGIPMAGSAFFAPSPIRTNLGLRHSQGPSSSSSAGQPPFTMHDERRSSSSGSTNDHDDEFADAPPPNPKAVALANAAIEGQSGTQQQQDMLIALNETMSMCLDLDGVARCPFPNCTKTFAKNRSYNLKTHLRSHSQLKPFACQSCPRAFSRKHDLERHARVHSGDKPYICEVCGRGFPRSDALRRHWRVEKECGDKASEIEAGQPLPSVAPPSNGLHAPAPSQGQLPSQFPPGHYIGPNALPAGWGGNGSGANLPSAPAGSMGMGGDFAYGNGNGHMNGHAAGFQLSSLGPGIPKRPREEW